MQSISEKSILQGKELFNAIVAFCLFCLAVVYLVRGEFYKCGQYFLWADTYATLSYLLYKLWTTPKFYHYHHHQPFLELNNV